MNAREVEILVAFLVGTAYVASHHAIWPLIALGILVFPTDLIVRWLERRHS